MWSLGCIATPRGSHGRGLAAEAAPPWTRRQCLHAGLRMHLSPDLRSQHFLFLLGLTACSRGWDPGSRPESVWDSLAPIELRTLFSQFPPEMEFTSHLWSVHKLLQSTYSVPGIDATQQKYTHDPGKPILCRCLKNSDSAEYGHQMLIINYFFKRRNKKITRFHVYTVIILKIEAPELWSKHFWQKKEKKNIRENV